MKPFRILTKIWVPVALALVLSACRPAAGPVTGAPRPEPVPVIVTLATNVLWDRTVSIIGTLYPKDTATLAAQVEGGVETTRVDFGDRVSAGQELASIDTGSYQALLDQAAGNLAKARANLANARQNFDRVVELKKTGIASAADFDQAKVQVDQWQAELVSAEGVQTVAQLNFDRSKVKAPFDGAISQRWVTRGDFVKVGAPAFEMVNDSVLKFIFQVPERFGSMVKKGLPVSFGVDNYRGETFTGSVYLISPSVTTASRSFNVGALVTNTGFRLKASTFARGTLVVERSVPTPVVPLDSVVSFAGITKVFVIENDIARSRAVRVGRIRDGLQEIVEGLRAGETVVVSGQSKLSDGVAVTRSVKTDPSPTLGIGSSVSSNPTNTSHEAH